MTRILTITILAIMLWPCTNFAQDQAASKKPVSYAERMQARRKEIDTTHQRQALARMDILSLLHDGKNAEAIDKMETIVDSAICTAWDRANTYTGETRESELKFLRQMKEYRQKYPRDKQDELANKARKILADLK